MSENNGWQDIRSAPRDGRRLLLAFRKNRQHRVCCIASWNPSVGDETYPWISDEMTEGWRFDSFTHWQLLPPPPPETHTEA